MKIQNVDVSNLDIDKILSEKYDLGFLLNQIRNKKILGIFSPSVIDALRFLPQFNEAVIEARDGLSIDPQKVKQNLYILIGRRRFLEHLMDSKKIARGTFVLPNKDWENIASRIRNWKKKEFPTLPKVVSNIRLKKLGKAPHVWQEVIEDYILFEKMNPTTLIYRKQGAEINVKQDDKTQEHYIEIKIYADTDIRYLPKISQWKKIQKSLPGYYNPKELDENLVVTRFLLYVLRRHVKLNQNQALDWLESHDLTRPDYQHSSQELSRFEKLFLSIPRK